ncbi:MAG: hypothetical protein HXM82_00455 [Neisseria sp.]|nr:hypothetical protein [Neisseria sp.]
MNKIALSVLILLLVSGCVYPNMATPSSQIAPAYISSAKYSLFDCHQLQTELDSISQRESVLVVAQEQRVKNSEKQATWFEYGQGDGVKATELANVKGEKEAVRKALVLKSCAE